MKKRFFLGALIAGLLALFGGNRVFAANTATISGGKTWNICVETGTNYAGSEFAATIAKSGFESQVVFDDFNNQGCETAKLAAGEYTVTLNSPMNTGAVSYATNGNTLTFSIANVTNYYLNMAGSIKYHTEGEGEETTFPKVFQIEGECRFNGSDANITGDSCVDAEGKSYTDGKFIDTGIALFSEENASKDFEVYFELGEYAPFSSQIAQASLFNAKYENASKYYPGFVFRITSTNGRFELTSRQGVNSSSDKKTAYIQASTARFIKIVRKDGVITYSLNDDGTPGLLDDFSNFSAFFNQTAYFGAAQDASGNPMRFYNGVIKNMYIKLGEYEDDSSYTVTFDGNGGTGSMDSITATEGVETQLPANTFEFVDHLFSGWNTEADGSGEAYSNLATIMLSSGASDITLYAQWVDKANAKAILDNGKTVGVKMKKMASGSEYQSWDIKAIKMASALPENFDTTNQDSIISSSTVASIPIYFWYDDTDDLNIIYVYTETGAIEVGEDMSEMFRDMAALSDISGISEWDVSNVRNMEYLFYQDFALKDISPVASWNVSNVVNMHGVFCYAGVTSIDPIRTTQRDGYASWDVSNVENISAMFSRNKFSSLDAISNWDTSNVKNMRGLFSDIQVADIDGIAEWNTSNVTDMGLLFTRNRVLTNVDALATTQRDGYVSWDVSKVESMQAMFWNTDSLSDISGLADWDTSSVTNMDNIFSYSAFEHNYQPSLITDISPLAKWNTSNVTSMRSMFEGTGITNIDALATTQRDGYVSWDVSKVESMQAMFAYAAALTNIDGAINWNTSKVTTMYMMFNKATALTNIDGAINWNMSKVTTMYSMFGENVSLTNIDGAAGWDVSNVTEMTLMFARDTSLVNIDGARNWNVSSTADTGSMFTDIPVSSSDLPDWYHS